MTQEVDIATYTSRFNDHATLCPGMVTPEEKNVERYIWGLPQPIKGLFIASKPTTFYSNKRLAFILSYQEIRRGMMVQKTNIPKVEGRKWMVGKESKKKAKKPS